MEMAEIFSVLIFQWLEKSENWLLARKYSGKFYFYTVKDLFFDTHKVRVQFSIIFTFNEYK